MKKIELIIAILVVLSLNSGLSFADYLSIGTFDEQNRSNNQGGKYDIWMIDWNDPNQECQLYFDSSEKLRNWGASLRIYYDVEAKEKAACGALTLLPEINLTKFDRLIFYIKGDKQKGFSDKIMVELSTPDNTSRVTVNGITDSWQRKIIPLSSFDEIDDWSKVTKFAIVFEDNHVTKKTGMIYFDDIYFSDSERPL